MKQYVSITEMRSTVIAIEGTDNSAAAVAAVIRAYRNGDITLSHNACIVEDQTKIKNETPDWQKAVAGGYDDSHFITLKLGDK